MVCIGTVMYMRRARYQNALHTYIQFQLITPALNARPIATQFHWYGLTTDVTAKHSFDTKQHESLIYLAYFVDMLSIDVCTNRQCQAFGRLV